MANSTSPLTLPLQQDTRRGFLINSFRPPAKSWSFTDARVISGLQEKSDGRLSGEYGLGIKSADIIFNNWRQVLLGILVFKRSQMVW